MFVSKKVSNCNTFTVSLERVTVLNTTSTVLCVVEWHYTSVEVVRLHMSDELSISCWRTFMNFHKSIMLST